MARYRKKPAVVEATQWFKNGDHPEDDLIMSEGGFEREGKIVRRWRHPARGRRHPDVGGEEVCEHCSQIMRDHGWIKTLEGRHTVCPGDWIITDEKGEIYPCKPDVFEMTYDKEIDAPKANPEAARE